MTLKIQPIFDARNELTDADCAHEAIVLSTRIRLARNLRGERFPGWADSEQRRRILRQCEEAISALPLMQEGLLLEIDQLNDLEKQVLVERHLISRELTGQPDAGVAISSDQSCAIMINEEDHLRMQVLRRGFDFEQVWQTMDALDTELEQSMPYAFSCELGYLTACPTNVGTGLRASVMMHLPGLVISGQMEKVIRAVAQLGLAVRGLFGEGSDATGSIFQISNQQTLGESEGDIMRKLSGVLRTVVQQEDNARLKLCEKQPKLIADKIDRAYGILSHAHVITSAEAMNLLSLLRLGCDLGFIEAVERPRMDRLFIEIQPGHIQVSAHHPIDSAARDQRRADFLREEMTQLSPPRFDRGPFRG